MKKFLNLILVFILTIFLSACFLSPDKNNKRTINEVYHKSYDVGEIKIGDLEKLITEMIEIKSPAIVTLKNYTQETPLSQLTLASFGSCVIYKGFIVKKNNDVVSFDTSVADEDILSYRYYVLTNRHVVEKNNEMRAYFSEDELEVKATVLGKDDKTDLAICSFDTLKYIKPLTIGDSNALKRGQFVFAIGTPYQLEFADSVTKGIISHPKRFLAEDTDNDKINDWEAEYIQHDAAINPGNSGGPLLNLKGEVIGINTLKFVDNKIDSLGFSIPSHVILNLIPYLEKGTTPKRFTIGITLLNVLKLPEEEKNKLNLTGIKHGLYVSEIKPGSIADMAGVLKEDVIIYCDGKKILRNYELAVIKNLKNEGDTSEVKVLRHEAGIWTEKTLTFVYK